MEELRKNFWLDLGEGAELVDFRFIFRGEEATGFGEGGRYAAECFSIFSF